MELFVGVVGVVGVVFVVIFGGRGLIDLVRGYSERRQARQALADDPPGAAEELVSTTAAAVAIKVADVAVATTVAPARPARMSESDICPKNRIFISS